MNAETAAPSSVDITDYVAVIRRHWKLVVACGLVMMVLALAYSFTKPTVYVSRSQIALLGRGGVVGAEVVLEESQQRGPVVAGRRLCVCVGEAGPVEPPVVPPQPEKVEHDAGQQRRIEDEWWSLNMVTLPVSL